MSRELGQALKDLQPEQQSEAGARGWKEIPPWVFSSEVSGLLHPHNLWCDTVGKEPLRGLLRNPLATVVTRDAGGIFRSIDLFRGLRQERLG